MAKVLTYGVSGQIAEYGNEMGQVTDPLADDVDLMLSIDQDRHHAMMVVVGLERLHLHTRNESES